MQNVSGSCLELRHEGASGYRHYLDGRAVHAGTLLEVLTDSGWVPGRYEWCFQPERSPFLVTDDGTDEAVVVGSNAIIRWPHGSANWEAVP